MKKILSVLFTFTVIALVFVGCEDRSDVAGPTSGSVSYDRFVTIGNSITAGYQSGSLFESAQKYSYGNLIAKQAGIGKYEMPIFSDPGSGGRMEFQGLDSHGNPIIVTNTQVGAPTNLTYPAPYNNLGIPGALLYDVLNATNSSNCASGLAGKPNQMFDIILRNSSFNIGSQFAQTKVQQPTLVTCWIGNNDVLGYATSGGFSPSAPTGAPTFDVLYRALADSLKSLNTKVVVANIPDVTSIPFFNTIGPKVALGTPWKAKGIPGLFYQKHGATAYDPTAMADSASLLKGIVDLTLPAGSFAAFLGDTTGAAWTAIAGYLKIPVAYVKPAFVVTAYPFGFHPLNPIPDVLVLDASEIAAAQTATLKFNTSIDTIARNRGFAVVNINSFFNQIRARDFTGGTYYGGINFTTGYITGGLFSLDGVHPTNHAHAIIANEFIKVINAKWGGSIPLVDVSTITPSLILGKKISFDHYGIPKFAPGAFDNLLF